MMAEISAIFSILELRKMNELYCILFSNGGIKVGKSYNSKNRINEHKSMAAGFNIEIVNTFAGVFHIDEETLIEFCRVRAKRVVKNEWFYGLDFNVVSRYMKSRLRGGLVRNDDGPWHYDLKDDSFESLPDAVKGTVMPFIEKSLMEIHRYFGYWDDIFRCEDRELMKHKLVTPKINSKVPEDCVIGYLIRAYAHYQRSLESAIDGGREHPGFIEYICHWLHADKRGNFVDSQEVRSMFNLWFPRPSQQRIRKGESFYF